LRWFIIMLLVFNPKPRRVEMSTLIRSCCSRAYNLLPERVNALQVARSVTTGALAGYTFSILNASSLINPVGGAIFGGVSALACLAQHKLFTQTGLDKRIDASAYKNSAYYGIFIARLAISAVVTTALGFPVTFISAAALSVAINFFNHIQNDCARRP
jgi:hypothetical protein